MLSLRSEASGGVQMQMDMTYASRLADWDKRLRKAEHNLCRWKHTAEIAGWDWECKICMNDLGDCSPACCKGKAGRSCATCVEKLIADKMPCPFCRQAFA